MRAWLIATALFVCTSARAHTANRSSCRVDTRNLEGLGKPTLRVSCEIPVASEQERTTLSAALSSLVQMYAQDQHDIDGSSRKECTWIDGPRVAGQHNDALLFEGAATCPDRGGLEMDLAYLSWHPAPHAAEVSVGDGRMLRTHTASVEARKVSVRYGKSERLAACGFIASLMFFVLFIASNVPTPSRRGQVILVVIAASFVSLVGCCVFLAW